MPEHSKPKNCDLFAGWVSGVAGLVAGAPFEAVKTKQQHLDIGFRDGAHTIKRLEGYLGFFRGLTLPILFSGPFNAIYFGLYGHVLNYMKDRHAQKQVPHDVQQQPGVNDPAFMSKAVTHNLGKLNEAPQIPATNIWDHVAAGSIAGSAQVFLMCPVEVIRTRQLAYGGIVKSPIDCLAGLYRAKGIKGLYKGFYPLAGRNLIGGIIQGLVFKMAMDKLRGSSAGSNSPDVTWFHCWLAGGFAGMVSWWVVAPLDVVKTKIQADEIVSPKYSGTINCAKKILANEGRIGLFRGSMSLSLPIFFVNGATFLVFNWASLVC